MRNFDDCIETVVSIQLRVVPCHSYVYFGDRRIETMPNKNITFYDTRGRILRL